MPQHDDEYEAERRRYVERQEHLTGRSLQQAVDSVTSYASGGAFGGVTHDLSEAEEHATREAGDSGDRSLFSNALSKLHGKHESLAGEEVDEGFAVSAHKMFFSSDSNPSSGQATSSGVGNAAALEALKMFAGGGSSSSGGMFGSSSGASGGQNAFVGMAMAQASKLYDQQASQGNTHPESSKDEAVNEAAKMAMKMYLKSDMAGGSSGSGGGGLMGMASKFL